MAEVTGEVDLGLALVEDGQAFADRKELSQCNVKEYLDAEFRASRSRFGVRRGPSSITRPRGLPQRQHSGAINQQRRVDSWWPEVSLP